MTRTGMFVGTVDYMAPEQVEGRRIDARVDVYALGCVTYQLLSGKVPFPRDSDIAKLYAHVNEPRPRLDDVPAPLADAVQRAMAKSPDDRFLSAGDFGRAVEAGARGLVDASDGRTVAIGSAAIGEPTAGPSPAGAPTELARTRKSGKRFDDASERTELASARKGAARVLEPATTAEAQLGGGRNGSRRGRLRGVPAVLVGLVIVALLGGGLAAALVASSSSSTSTETVFRHQTKPAAKSTPTASTPTTSTSATTAHTTPPTPTPAATQVEIFNVVGPSGGLAVHVTNTVSGSCFTGSSAIGRSDAWRCTVGNNLIDPCFATGAAQVLCPADGPWGSGLLVNLPSNDLSNALPDKDQGMEQLPWAIELDNGWKCLALTGATTVIDGQRLGYGCSNGAGLYGKPHRSSSVWTINAAAAHANAISLLPIKQAWF